MIAREPTAQERKELAEALTSLRPRFPLDDEQAQELAQRAGIREVLRGEIVMRQGDEPDVLYFIMSGQLRAADTTGDEPKLLYYHAANSFVGELGMVYNQPRGATVDVLTDAKLAYWDWEAFNWLLGQNDKIEPYLARLQEEYVRVRLPFPGKQWDEVTLIRTGKHSLTLLSSLLWPLVLLIFSLALLGLLLVIGATSLTLIAVIAGFPAAIALLLGALNYIDWKNDEYIVTSKRVIHIERYVLRGRERDEAPLVRIQDVTMVTGSLLQRALDYHDLTIQTAGAGTIMFKGLPHAQQVRDQIFLERAKARERREAADKSTIRQALAQRIGTDVPEIVIPEETLEIMPETPTADKEPCLPVLLDYLLPRTRVVKGDTITWRKHWFIWLKKTWWTLLLTLISFSLMVLALVLYLLERLGQGSVGLVAVLILVLSTLVSFVLYLYQHDAWRRDIYIVTSTRIIDVEGTPFRLGGEERREGTFDAVQNITYDIPGFFQTLIKMGSVTIETAGTAATFTFDDVLNPSVVHQEVFNRMVAFQERRRREEQEQQAARLGEWFSEYHELENQRAEGNTSHM